MVYDHDPLKREADFFAGLRCVLQEQGVNDDSGGPGKPELMDKLVDGVCRVRVSSNTMNKSLSERGARLRRDSAQSMQRPECDRII